MGKIILTGDRPTGRLHVGHYVGSLRNRVVLQNSGKFDKLFFMIADAQALTDNFDNPGKVRENILQVALDYMACGIDPAKSHMFIQSVVCELTELTFYYMNLVTLARLERRSSCGALTTASPWVSSPIPSARRRTSPRSWRTPCRWARISCP